MKIPETIIKAEEALIDSRSPTTCIAFKVLPDQRKVNIFGRGIVSGWSGKIS